MTQFQSLLFLTFIIVAFNVTIKAPVLVDAKLFEYELPNRTITICPSYSLISLECPQISSSSDQNLWQTNLPKYLMSIDYIRSFPLRLGFEPRSCQPDFSHACNNYDLRYINALCNGKPQCSDISAYQIRERSLCAFKAVTEIGFHCVPTWNLYEIQTKYDICKNSSLTNDYGFIYSRNYPLKTSRISCFTTIYTRPNYKIILYYVNGELNHDQLRIESVTSDRIPILNITLNGNITTQRLTTSIYELKITFIPSQTYSYHPTYYLLYFYTVPICTVTEPCLPEPPLVITTPFILPTTRMRIQSVGWTRVPNIWIVIPIILAYILLLLLVVVLALLFQRRRKQQKLLENTGKTNLSSRYLDVSGASSRAQLVTPLPLPPPPPSALTNTGTYHRTNPSQNVPYPLSNAPFSQNMDRYYRSSRSDFDLHQNNIDGIDYRHHASIPHRIRPAISNDNYRGYGTMDYNYDGNRPRRLLPKSFSDCDLCKRRVVNEEYQQYFNEQDDNWHLENTTDRRIEPRPYRDKIKERFRDRVTTRQIPDGEIVPPATTTVEYSTVLPRHQRIASESNRSNTGPIQHLPFDYIPNENSNNNIRTGEFKRHSSQERLGMTNNQQHGINDENSTNNINMKYYERDDDDTKTRLNRYSHDTREIQEMSMRMNDQQNLNRHQYYH